MASPNSLENTLRIHDAAIQAWLNTLLVDYGTVNGASRNSSPILNVMATPDRAIAEVVDALVKRGWLMATTVQQKYAADEILSVLPFPFATFRRNDPVLDPELAGVPKVHRRAIFDPVTGKYIPHRWPGHYQLPYTISFWCQKKFSEAFIREWIMSQLGTRGLRNDEMLLTVQHAAPWGAMPQAFRLQSFADQTQYEGDDVPYRRFDAEFNLRMWLMYNPLPEESPVLISSLISTITEIDPYTVTTDNPGDAIEQTPINISGNLFQWPEYQKDYATLWPKTGNATVTFGKSLPPNPIWPYRSLNLTLTGRPDSVELLEVPLPLSGNGTAIVCASMEYISTGSFEFALKQRTAATDTLSYVASTVLPASSNWATVSQFTIIDKSSIRADLCGLYGTTSNVLVSQLDFRLVYDETHITPASSSGDVYQFTGLTFDQTYLAVVLITNTTGGGNTITAANDAASPTVTNQQAVDQGVNVGAVLLIQPLSTTVTVSLSSGVSASAIYLIPYFGSWRGNNYPAS